MLLNTQSSPSYNDVSVPNVLQADVCVFAFLFSPTTNVPNFNSAEAEKPCHRQAQRCEDRLT